ncbi:pectinesterase inhibitor 3-like [Curcuma longa]|uniref:pectinesterase inhibitor 3-like n=1 Tax=Curcuma longa TaxID=136217 RepID=UPI003D9DE50E
MVAGAAFLLLILLACAYPYPSRAAAAPSPSSSIVLSACAHARYPSLCVRTLNLTTHSSDTDFARITTASALSSARHAAAFLRGGPLPASAAFRECARLLLHSVDQLDRASRHLAGDKAAPAPRRLGDAQTWVSAAMTDQDMCLQELGAEEAAGSARNGLSARVTAAWQLASNALYFINQLSDSRGRGRNN